MDTCASVLSHCVLYVGRYSFYVHELFLLCQPRDCVCAVPSPQSNNKAKQNKVEKAAMLLIERIWISKSFKLFFDPCKCHMDLRNESCLYGRPSCMAKFLLLDMTCKLLNQIFSYVPYVQVQAPFIPLLLTLTLPGGHKVSSKQNLLASFSPTLIVISGL